MLSGALPNIARRKCQGEEKYLRSHPSKRIRHLTPGLKEAPPSIQDSQPKPGQPFLAGGCSTPNTPLSPTLYPLAQWLEHSPQMWDQDLNPHLPWVRALTWTQVAHIPGEWDIQLHLTLWPNDYWSRTTSTWNIEKYLSQNSLVIT